MKKGFMFIDINALTKLVIAIIFLIIAVAVFL
jgi:hypothetical protein